MQNNNTEIVLLRNSEWDTIDGRACRVVNFVPMGSTIKNNKFFAVTREILHAFVTLEVEGLSNNVTGYITHKIDFINLWKAFEETRLRKDMEVIIFWNKKHLKRLAKIFSLLMPRLWVAVCRKESFELMTNNDHRPELTGVARWNAMKPMAEWKPTVIE
mgnify:CR=1 FL=1